MDDGVWLGRLASPQGRSVCQGHLFGLYPVACPSAPYKQRVHLILLRLGRGISLLAGPCRSDQDRSLQGFDVSFGTLAKGLDLLSLEGLTWGTHRFRRPPWPPWSHGGYLSKGVKEKTTSFPAWMGGLPSTEGGPEQQPQGQNCKQLSHHSGEDRLFC